MPGTLSKLGTHVKSNQHTSLGLQGGRSGSSGSCWWVTYAENDEQASMALELVASLRATGSTKETCIIYNGDEEGGRGGCSLSPALQLVLEECFDYTLEMRDADFTINVKVEPVDESELEQNEENWPLLISCLPVNVRLCLSAWKLCNCKKAVLLHPSLVFTSNCDDLFTIDFRDLSAPPKRTMAGFESSVLVFKPNKNTFANILKKLLVGSLAAGLPVVDISLELVLLSYFGSEWTPLGLEYATEDRMMMEFEGRGRESSPKIFTNLDHVARNKIVRRSFLYLEMCKRSGPIEPIAIVGLACRFPGANNETEFWDLLHGGCDATKPLPPSRIFTRGSSIIAAADETPAGYLKCDIEAFDAKFFHISRREAEYMDPQQRLLLQVAWESLENAGIDPQSLRGSSASTYVGMWSQEYAMVRGKAAISAQDSHLQYLGNAFCGSSARISHFFGLRGPSVTFESGCASSLEAVHYGCESLRGGTTDLVLAGGVNIVLKSLSQFSAFDSFVLSKDGKCKTFDKDANGFARAEAVVVLVLKRLSSAMADEDNILGLLSGSAVTSDGAGSSMGTPNPKAQELAVRNALKRAGLAPHEISYIEAHGTGTPVGDPIEFQGLNSVFGNDPQRKTPLVVGSVKTNIGHCEGASGLAGLVKVLLAMRARSIPRHLNLAHLNPAIDLEQIPALIPLTNVSWTPSSARGLVAGVSSFGLSGTNVHVVVQEPPPTTTCQKIQHNDDEDADAKLDKDKTEQSCHILTLSASSEPALNELIGRYMDLLATGEQSLFDVAYSANTGRAHLSHRLAVLAESTGEAYTKLKKGQYMVGKRSQSQEADGCSERKIVFLFTGQGSQYVGMSTELYDTHPYFKYCFDICGSLLSKNHSLDLHSIIKDSQAVHEQSQVALFCVGVCLAKLWQSFGIRPDYVLGHSVGEFAAAVLAGGISLEDGLKLVVERAALVSRLPKGAMLVVRCSASETAALVAEFLLNNTSTDEQRWIDIAAFNSNEETVLSGPVKTIAAFEEFCSACTIGEVANGKCRAYTVRLSASHAFHSRAMDSILDEYRQIAASVLPLQMRSGRPKFISGTLAQELDSSQLNTEYWVSHLRQPVSFAAAFDLLAPEYDVFIEIGPQPILLPLGMSLLPPEKSSASTWAPSLRRNESNWSTMLTSLGRLYTGGVDVDWCRFYGAAQQQQWNRIALPNYPWQGENYWMDLEGGRGGKVVAADSLTVHSTLLHPLLGRRVPLARSEHVSYVNSLRIGTEPLSFLRDHKVGDTIVLPAAGFLEIVLAVGADFLTGADGGGRRGCGRGLVNIPLTVEDLVVESALALSEDGTAAPVQIQTTVDTLHPDGDGSNETTTTTTGQHHQLKYKVSIFKQTSFDSSSGGDGGSWRKLATATFVPCAAVSPEVTQNIDLDTLRNLLTLRPTASEDLYKKLDEHGLNFGPQFRSVQRVWSDEERILVESSRPSDNDTDSYVCHPILLDAMVQSISALPEGSPNDLHLPVVIHKFVSVPRSSAALNSSHNTQDEKMYILVNQQPKNETTRVRRVQASLYNALGEFVALMDGVDLLPTTIDSFLSSLRTDSQSQLYPTFFDETWVSRLGPNGRRLQPMVAFSRFLNDETRGSKPISTAMKQVDDEKSMEKPMDLAYKGITSKLNHLAYLYILKSLRELGWRAPALNPGMRVSIKEFASGVNEECAGYWQLLRRWFQILQEENDVTFDDDDDCAVTVQNLPPEPEELQRRIAGSISSFGQPRSIEVEYVICFGEALTSLITGQLSPLRLLFPDEQNRAAGGGGVGAVELYTSGTTGAVHTSAALAIRALVTEAKRDGSSLPVLRLLEIGGGTGSLTRLVLRELEQLDIPYEYTFTDISPLFLKLASGADKQLPANKNCSVRFELLDIEVDPKRQGFVPESYDIVIADMVLHATTDLTAAVAHARNLLVPGGALLLVEIVERHRLLDISFGFLDGWWRFSDTELRRDYPCISSERWIQLLAENGFSKPESVMPVEDDGEAAEKQKQIHDVIVGFKNDDIFSYSSYSPTAIMPSSRRPLWLIFGFLDDPLTLALKHRLLSANEKVLLVLPSNLGKESSLKLPTDEESPEMQIELNVNHEEDYVRLLESVLDSGFSIAGILYLWALRTSAQLEETTPRRWTGQKDHDGGLTLLIQPLSHTINAISSGFPKDSLTFYMVTSGLQCVSEADFISSDPLGSVLIGILSTTNNESAGHQFVSIGVQLESCALEEAAGDIFATLWEKERGAELYIAFRDGVKWLRRIQSREEPSRPLQFPNTDRYELMNPGTGSFADFKISPAVERELGEEQIEVSVRAASLNFKDLLVALSTQDETAGIFMEQQRGGPTFTTSDAQDLGLDFAGVVSRIGSAVRAFKVGDRVFGCTLSGLGGSLASHVVVPQTHVAHMADGASYEDQACLGAVLLTVYYFLVRRANICSGDKVLIHTASGGVGLLAVQVAVWAGAEVYATAGSHRKRSYLRNIMGLEHVYNSRTTEFGGRILEHTGGVGVDIVLNSLTGTGFKEATLSACAHGARFLEMSKLNIWSAEQVRDLRPDVTYVVQDLATLPKPGTVPQFLEEAVFRQVFKFGETLRTSGVWRQLPFTLFTLSRVHDAFRYLQSAKHIGKVVIKMPSTQLGKNGRLEHKEELFNEYGSYLITGGLGGIGLQVAAWMVGSGAKFLVLVGRSRPTSATEVVIEQLRGEGQVLVLQADVANYEACTRILDEMKGAGFPPLRGIMHAAGVVPGTSNTKDPAASPELGQQTMESYLATCRPKVHGTWNLHALSLRHNLTLDHFVLFSSVAATIGGIGQGNYVAANRYQDAFGLYRRSLGLPAISIAWGSWSDVGAAAPIVHSLERAFGLKEFSPAQGIASLERILLEHRASAIVTNISDWKILRQAIRQGNLLQLIRSEQPCTSNLSSRSWYERQVRVVQSCSDPEDRFELVKEFVEVAVRATLKLSEGELIDPDADLRVLGIDSLMAMEVRAKLHLLLKDKDKDIGVEGTNNSASSLTLQSFMDSRTINKLSSLVTGILNEKSGRVVESRPQSQSAHHLSHEQLLALVQNDCVLPEDICVVPEPAAGPLGIQPVELKHVLLTGATGALGAFILAQLISSAPHLTIHCLIRAESNGKAQDRLLTALHDFNLTEAEAITNLTRSSSRRVVCIAGNLLEAQFGLSDTAYGELTTLIDGVIHSAALVNHLLPYAYEETGRPDDIRSTNVLGLLNVIRFVVTGKVKVLQHQSTMGIVPIVDDDERHGTDGETRFESRLPQGYWGQAVYQSGYLLSKFVCEKLLEAAATSVQAAGLSITIVRHTYLSGDTLSGRMTGRPSRDHGLMVAAACLGVKAVPDTNMHFQLVPIDIAAAVSVSIFLRGGSTSTRHDDKDNNGIYALNNPGVVHVSELHAFLRGRGIECRLVPYDEWREAVLSASQSQDSPDFAPLAEFYTRDLFSSDMYTKAEIYRQLMSERPALANSAKLKRVCPNIDERLPHSMELFRLYLDRNKATFEGNDDKESKQN